MEKRVRYPLRKRRATHTIDFRANLSTITSLKPVGLDSILFDLTCLQCGKHYPKCPLSNDEIVIDEGVAHLVQHCKDCNKTFWIRIADNCLPDEIKSYENWHALLNVYCQGCRIDLVNCIHWNVLSESGRNYEWNGEEDRFQFDDSIEKPSAVADLDFYVHPYA